MPKASIVLVCWNSGVYLPRCLSALRAQTCQDFEVILVDNGSTEGSTEGIRDASPELEIHVEKLGYNHGFAAANNIGARLARGQWLALLNADAFPEPDWLENLLKAAEEHTLFSCFSSRQVMAGQPEFLDGAGDAYHFSGVAWRRYIGYPSEEFGLKKEEVFSPCAAASLYRRDAFLDVGGFDEDFFSYFEDIDLGFRLRLRGFRVLYVPDAIVRHVGSATLGVNSDFSLYHTQRNLIWTFFKNMPIRLFWKSLPAHITANLSYLFYYTIKGRGKVLWRSKFDALRGLPNMLKKRKEIQTNRKASEEDLAMAMEHGILKPYLRSLRYHRAQSTQEDKRL